MININPFIDEILIEAYGGGAPSIPTAETYIIECESWNDIGETIESEIQDHVRIDRGGVEHFDDRGGHRIADNPYLDEFNIWLAFPASIIQTNDPLDLDSASGSVTAEQVRLDWTARPINMRQLPDNLIAVQFAVEQV